MNRLTSNKKTSEMGMYELSHNCMFIKDGEAWYRDFDREISLRNMVREIMEQYEGEYDEQLNDDELLDIILFESLQYPVESGISGFIAIFNMLAWSLADLRERLKKYEDLEEQGRLLELPVKPGTIVYKIVSGCVSEADLCDGKCVNCNDYQEYILEPVMSIGAIVSQLKDFGKSIFLTREEAEKALKKMKEGETDDKSR